MAIRIRDSYSGYNATADLLARSGFLQYQQPLVNTSPLSFVAGPNGRGKALQIQINVTKTYRVYGQRVASAFPGTRYQLGQPAGGLMLTYEDTIANDTQVSVFFNPGNYAIQIYRGDVTFDPVTHAPIGTLLYASPNNVWSGTSWFYVDCWPVIDPSAGSVQVKVNGVVRATISGVNTQNTANAWWDREGIQGVGLFGGSPTVTLCDMYYGDTTTGPGTNPCETPQGPVIVWAQFPVADSGSPQWTPLSGDNYTQVCDPEMDGDTTYNYTSTVGNIDGFTFGPALPATAVILDAGLRGAYRTDAGGSRTILQSIISSATEEDGTDYVVGATYTYTDDQFTINPHTSASWLVSEWNAITGRYKLAA